MHTPDRLDVPVHDLSPEQDGTRDVSDDKTVHVVECVAEVNAQLNCMSQREWFHVGIP